MPCYIERRAYLDAFKFKLAEENTFLQMLDDSDAIDKIRLAWFS